MKKLTTFLIMLTLTGAVMAQKGKVTSALSYKEAGKLDQAVEAIEIAVDPNNKKAESSILWPRTWEARGEIYQEVYKKGKTELAKEPLFIAFDSYVKALEIDEKSRYAKSLIVKFTFLKTDLSNYAIKAFEEERFDVALECFEKYLDINKLSIMSQNESDMIIDTAIVYNAGLVAYMGENWNKAIEYFKQSSENDYNGGASFYYIMQSQRALGDTLSSIQTLKSGFERYPDNETLMMELINFYIKTGKAEDAVAYIDKAIARMPENASLFTAKGAMLERLNRPDDAIEVYKKSIEFDQSQFTPYYNISVIYYNRGVETINEASKLPPSENEKYEAETEKGKEQFRKALPYLEKAYELDSTQMAILESLRLIYYRLGQTDQYNEINTKIQSLK